MATGLLPILIGDYTKISKYLIEHDKTYIAKLKLGIKTDTGDITGNILEKQDVSKISNIEEIINSFKGVQKQTPPMYSAIKIDGKKLYEYAREGKEVEIPERIIEIYDIKLLNANDGEIEFMVSCSKGTYIRVLCEDIARALGTIGTMSSLRRIVVDKFSIDDAYTFEKLENSKDNKSILIKMEDIFNDIDEINLNAKKLELFLNGVKLSVELEDGLYNIYSDNKYIGLGIVKNKLLKRDVVIGE